jgi:hypothetical protein
MAFDDVDPKLLFSYGTRSARVRICRRPVRTLGLVIRGGDTLHLAVGGNPAPSGALPPAQVLRHEFPVDELVEHGFHIVDASILVVEIVGVLPYVDRQQSF